MEQNTKCTTDGLNAFKLDFVRENISHLLGEILTVIDASLEGEKNKAVKDLIKDKFSKKQDWFSECAFKQLPKENEGVMASSSDRPYMIWYNGMYKMVDY